jgi:hypothetical protein
VLALAGRRAPDRTICPSDAARAVGGAGWRAEMDLVRDVARSLARDGRVELLQRGAVVAPDDPVRGPLRIRATTA